MMTAISKPPTAHRPRPSQLPGTLFELGIITLIGLLYITFILSTPKFGELRNLSLRGLDPANRFGGVEYERLAGTIVPIELGLKNYGYVPTWNPYLNTGTPLLNNAFSYLFNPFHSMPILLLGGVQGSKFAIMIGLLLAGYNAWALMRAIGVGRVARITAGALYMMSGGIIAKYTSGHFQLGLSLAWPPLVLAGLWWTLHTTDRRAPVLMAVAFALLFFAGNIYYTLHTLVCCAFILLLHIAEKEAGRWRIQWPRIRRVLIGGGFGFGLALIQFVPIWSVQGFIAHKGVVFNESGQFDPAYDSYYDLTQALNNYIYPWEDWSIFQLPPFTLNVVVDYAYVGPTVLLFIALLGVALLIYPTERYRRAAIAALILGLLMMTWGAGQTPVLHELYARIDLLSQFRYVGRAHSIGALWWIVLASLSIDVLWRGIQRLQPRFVKFEVFSRNRLGILLLLTTLGWFWFFIYSFMDHATRLQLVLNNTSVYSFLNERVLADYHHAADVLWWLVLMAMVAEWLIVSGLWLRNNRQFTIFVRFSTVHIVRLLLMTLVLTAIADEMSVNYKLISFGTPVNNFGVFYDRMNALNEPDPFASVQEPYSPSGFDNLYSGTRNWLLNEGWEPETLPDIIPIDSPHLLDMAGWAIASNEYSGAAYELAISFIENNQNEFIACQQDGGAVRSSNTCDFVEAPAASLYRLPAALPYALIASTDDILTAADTITRAAAILPDSIDHGLDTITLQARTPDNPDQTYYLIVQETNFPGWQAFIDGIPVPPVTIERFVSIPMLAGDHIYTLRYQTPGLATGFLGSIVTLLLIFFYLRRPALPVESKPASLPA